ncbi:MAG: hypothetical protein DMG71_06445 [Acidobacteria bacterium]|nr:MAG: hypothetical protein DMG71_06445 [Acidobacteriota bacterium]
MKINLLLNVQFLQADVGVGFSKCHIPRAKFSGPKHLPRSKLLPVGPMFLDFLLPRNLPFPSVRGGSAD